ncbi:Lcl C-terminal domain-containing protein [Sphaerotilus hippei]|uniref:Lcl C-terminal domain-containing protein n=1 Tax=Sphaerotilus hippei TaxID=744406 RepID=UPI000D761A59
MCHPPRPRQTTTGNSPVRLPRWRPDLTQRASTNPGAVQDAVNPGPRLTYQQAKALAVGKSTIDERWRLPTRKELLTLREPNCHNPSQNLNVFPTKPEWSSDGAFWSSTPEAQGVSVVSAIGTSDAWASTDGANTNHVRLVRTPPTSHKK